MDDDQFETLVAVLNRIATNLGEAKKPTFSQSCAKCKFRIEYLKQKDREKPLQIPITIKTPW